MLSRLAVMEKRMCKIAAVEWDTTRTEVEYITNLSTHYRGRIFERLCGGLSPGTSGAMYQSDVDFEGKDVEILTRWFLVAMEDVLGVLRLDQYIASPYTAVLSFGFGRLSRRIWVYCAEDEKAGLVAPATIEFETGNSWENHEASSGVHNLVFKHNRSAQKGLGEISRSNGNGRVLASMYKRIVSELLDGWTSNWSAKKQKRSLKPNSRMITPEPPGELGDGGDKSMRD
ncbi:hypothetical protein C8R45DRAFT_932701 [Mycena sanguinolenta]|nr:hypothetical protein C8R45DRAFT_932701 [Mycena sanguinolenta]